MDQRRLTQLGNAGLLALLGGALVTQACAYKRPANPVAGASPGLTAGPSLTPLQQEGADIVGVYAIENAPRDIPSGMASVVPAILDLATKTSKTTEEPFDRLKMSFQAVTGDPTKCTRTERHAIAEIDDHNLYKLKKIEVTCSDDCTKNAATYPGFCQPMPKASPDAVTAVSTLVLHQVGVGGKLLELQEADSNGNPVGNGIDYVRVIPSASPSPANPPSPKAKAISPEGDLVAE